MKKNTGIAVLLFAILLPANEQPQDLLILWLLAFILLCF